jgi:hypothetical protein
MSYATINQNANDYQFLSRLTAALAQEGAQLPDEVVMQVRWPVCSASDIEAAYAFAINSDNPNPGGDETVITDQMILSAVQAHMSATP